jgi:DNA-directed RNA polymerase specialized sigma24 family protein
LSQRRRAERGVLFEEYLPVARSVAVRCSRTWGMNVNDVVEEAEGALGVLLCEGWGRFDIERGSASTFIQLALHRHLIKWCKREQRRTCYSLFEDGVEELEELRTGIRVTLEPATPVGLVERLWGELGNEGRMLLRVVFEAPGALGEELWVTKRDVVKLKRGTKEKRAAVLKHLRRAQWNRRQIHLAFKQVEECLS